MAKTKPVTAEELGAAIDGIDDISQIINGIHHRMTLSISKELPDLDGAIHQLVVLSRNANDLALTLMMAKSRQESVARSAKLQSEIEGLSK